MPLILPNTIVNGENADAVPVEQNYSFIESYINNEVIQRNGSVAMNAPLLLVGDPTSANHAANKDYVDTKTAAGDTARVAKAGDTMTGQLIIDTFDQAIKLSKGAAANYSYMAFYDEDKTTRRGWVGIDPNDDLALTADTGHATVQATGSGRVVRLVGQSGTYNYNGLYVASAGPGGYALNVAAGPNYIHGGVNVYDTLNVASGGAGVNGGLTVADGFNSYSGAFNVSTTSNGWIQMSCAGSGSIQLNSGPSGNVGINTGGATVFYIGGVEYGRVAGGSLLWNKTVQNGYIQGVELNSGRVEATTSDRTCLSCRHIGGVDTGGTGFISFFAGTAAAGNDVLMAEIRQRSLRNGIDLVNAVVFAPSDYRLKNDLGPVVDALGQVLALSPRRLSWKSHPDQEFDGFIAHEVGDVAPYLVMGDKDAVTDTGAIEGQSLDYGGLTTLLTAAVQELAERVVALEDA